MHFKCIARDSDGKKIIKVRHGQDVGSVIADLKSEGLLPLKVHALKSAESPQFSLISNRVRSKELVIFTRQLAATLSSGLLLTDALETIAEDLENKYFQNIIAALVTDIRGGADFSTALSKFPKIFSITYIAIIKSGEATGRLDKTITELARYLENSERLKEKVITAIRYPLFIIGFAFLVVMVIVLFLIPKFKSMFDSAGAQLPLLTRVIVNISELCLHYSIGVLLAAVGAWILFLVLLRNPAFKYLVDVWKFKLPVVGKEVIYKASLSSFCRTLGVLLEGGVGLSKSLEITAQVVNHSQLSQVIRCVHERVISGSEMSMEIRSHRIFPSMIRKMVAVGEKTGRVSEMLKRTSDYYEEELENSLSRLTVMLEPMLIIFIGGIVLIVVLALYLPIFKISGALR